MSLDPRNKGNSVRIYWYLFLKARVYVSLWHSSLRESRRKYRSSIWWISNHRSKCSAIRGPVCLAKLCNAVYCDYCRLPRSQCILPHVQYQKILLKNPDEWSRFCGKFWWAVSGTNREEMSKYWINFGALFQLCICHKCCVLIVLDVAGGFTSHVWFLL